MNSTAMGRHNMIFAQKYGWHLRMNILKREMMQYLKQRIINKMIEKLKTTSEGAVTIKRRKAFYFMNSGEIDHDGTHTIFGQTFQQLRASSFDSFQKNNVDSKAFNVTFSGEGSQDAGGPFRDAITNMCKEIQSGCLPLLITTPNNKSNHGQYRECWIPNPSAKSPNHLEMFKFLGALLGFAIRTTSTLQLDLPSIFWKKILNEPVDLFNLKEIDTFSWQVLENLKLKAATLSKEEFEENVDERFITLLSDGSEVELAFRGRDKVVTQENLGTYIDLVVQTRLTEFDLQMKAIKEGINLIMPEHILFFMTWEEVDMRATGKKTIDIEALKKITIYEVSHILLTSSYSYYYRTAMNPLRLCRSSGA